MRGRGLRKLDKAKLNDLIATLEPKVRQLANVLSLQIAGGEDYTQIIVQAHAKMSRVAEVGRGAAQSRDRQRRSEPDRERGARSSGNDLVRQLRASFEQFDRGGVNEVCEEPVSKHSNVGATNSAPTLPKSARFPMSLFQPWRRPSAIWKSCA